MKSNSYPFPSDLDSPKEKSGKQWGLQAAKAIWSHNSLYGPSIFYNDRQAYETYLKYFRGEQEESITKESVGINPRDAKSTYVGGIRWQIKNYATKRVNVAVSKIFNRKYDPISSAIDPLSIDRREDYKANLRVAMEYGQWIQEMQQMTGVNMMPENVSIEDIPINDEELLIHMENNHKFKDEMDLELGMTHHLKRNEFELIKDRFDFDMFVLGVGAAYTGMDSNSMPLIKYCDPARVIIPRSDDPNYSRIKYAAYQEDYTVSEFRKLHGGEIDKDKEAILIDEHAQKVGDYDYVSSYYDDDVTFRDVDKIKVLHFEIESVDDHVYLEKEDKAGNKRFYEKQHDYYKTKDQQKKFNERYKGTRKLHRKPYKCYYTGYWVVGSDTVFRYEKKYNNTGRLGYKLYAPNMRNNRTVSTLKQMIPSLDLLETYDKKIQQIVASAIPKGVYIDLDALQNASFKMNGKDMSPTSLLELFFQKGIIIGSSGEKYGNGNGYKPIQEIQNGMSNDVVHYLNLIQQELNTLDEIIGINKVTAASSLHQDTGKAVAQQMQMSTEVALDYLYRGDMYLTQKIYEDLADLHIQSVKYNDYNLYAPVFGATAVRRMKESFSRYKYGIEVEARPTQQEWSEFYIDLKQYVRDGYLQPEDEIMIRRANNLKQAQAYMRVIMKRRKKEAQEAKAADIRANAEGQMASNQETHQNQLRLEEIKTELELRKIQEQRKTEALKHKWKMDELMTQGEIERDNKLSYIRQEGDENIQEIKMKGSLENAKQEQE